MPEPPNCRAMFFTRITLVFAGIIIASMCSLHSQTPDRKWSVGTGLNLLDYQGPLSGQLFEFHEFDMGYYLFAGRYLTRAFSLATDLTYAPTVRFPAYDADSYRPRLLDMSYSLNFRTNNGALLKETALIAPFLSVGVGGSYVKDHPDLYIPLGGGLQFRVNSSVSLRAHMLFKLSLNRDYQHIAHGLSFVYNFRSPGAVTAPVAYQPKLIPELLPADRDGDGIADIQDACPDVSGPGRYLGCPTEDALFASRMYALRGDAPVVPREIPVSAPAFILTYLEKYSLDVLAEAAPLTETPAEIPIAEVANSKSVLKNIHIPEIEMPESKEFIKKPTPTRSDTSSFLDNMPVKAAQVLAPVRVVEKPPTHVSAPKTVKPVEIWADMGELTPEKLSERHEIFFENGSDRLTEESLRVLDKVALMLQTYPEARLELSGYANETGDETQNKLLSIRRAFNVKYYLVYEKEVSMSRITSEGFGAKAPAPGNSAVEGRQQYRRVSMTFAR